MKEVNIGLKSAKDYWEFVVQPNEKAFFEAPSYQPILNLALGLWHLGEWDHHEKHPDLSKEQRKIEVAKYNNDRANKYDFFGDIRDIIDTGKHRVLDRSSVKVDSVPKFPSGPWGTAPHGTQPWGASGDKFYVLKDDGSLTPLASVFRKASAHWQQHFDGVAAITSSTSEDSSPAS
ncbi:hypothetical protein GAY28_14530 [Azospirillum brasilense]|nr:hypothetical protein [Azospirillum brasilense]